MAAIKRFEEIQAWQKARIVAKAVYAATSDGSFARDFGLRDQLRRSSVSAMANIAEGFGRRSDKEFANFLNIAQGSVAESQSHLYIALDLNYVGDEQFTELYAKFDEVGRMTHALAEHLRKAHK